MTAILTAFYTFRAYFLTFYGPTRIPPKRSHTPTMAPIMRRGRCGARHNGHLAGAGRGPRGRHGNPAQIHEGTSAMKWPLMVLAVFAVGVGLVVGPTHLFAGWIAQVRRSSRRSRRGIPLAAGRAQHVAALGGIGVAALMYAKPSNRPQLVRQAFGPLYNLSLNKFYLDEIANVLVIFPVKALAFASLLFDQGFVDRLVDEVAPSPALIGRFLRPVQNGLIQSYALVMLFGLAIFLTTILQLVPFP